MAFPGNRLIQKLIEIPVSKIPGTVSHDFPLILTEVDFTEEELTLGASGALHLDSLAASLEDKGLYRYAIDPIRVELNANYTLSKVEMVVRIPAGEVSTLDGISLWLWFKSDTDTLPADNEPYGRYDVYNPITDDTGTSIPLITRAALSFDESPSDSAPAFKDRSGSGGHAQPSSPGSCTRVTTIPGRGVSVTSSNITTSNSFYPGTGDWSIIQVGYGSATMFFEHDYWNMSLQGTSVRYDFKNGKGFDLSISTASALVFSMSRQGDTGYGMANEFYNSLTGLSADSFDTGAGAEIKRNFSAGTLSLTYLLYCAPNRNWLTLFSRVVNHTAGTIVSHASNPVGMFGEWIAVTIASVAVGSEIRIYEEPHAASWSIDYSGANEALIDNDYVTFEIVGASSTTKHLIYWDTDPSLSGYTAHQVTRTGNETDAQLAALVASVLDSLDDISASATGAVVRVQAERIGKIATPDYHGAQGEIVVSQIGGTSTDEVAGVEASPGTSWTTSILVDQPRLVTIVVALPGYEYVRIESYLLTQADAMIIAGQRVDLNYRNPDPS